MTLSFEPNQENDPRVVVLDALGYAKSLLQSLDLVDRCLIVPPENDTRLELRTTRDVISFEQHNELSALAV